MYLVAIAWLYVTIIMAASEASIVAAAMTLLSYGLLPLALFLWLIGTPQRRRSMRERAARQKADKHNGSDSQPD